MATKTNMIESDEPTLEGEGSMMSDETASSRNGSVVLDRWSARKVPPVVVLYVVAVFAAFIAFAHFIVHSPEAVKALAIAAVGAVAAIIPSVIARIEYQATESGVAKRSLNEKQPGQFEDALRWDQVSRVVPMRHGFRYFTNMNETNPIRRFWKAHISDRCSGEIHVEKRDLDRILGIVERKGIEIS